MLVLDLVALTGNMSMQLDPLLVLVCTAGIRLRADLAGSIVMTYDVLSRDVVVLHNRHDKLTQGVLLSLGILVTRAHDLDADRVGIRDTVLTLAVTALPSEVVSAVGVELVDRTVLIDEIIRRSIAITTGEVDAVVLSRSVRSRVMDHDILHETVVSAVLRRLGHVVLLLHISLVHSRICH